MSGQFLQGRQTGEWIRSTFKTQCRQQLVASEFKAAQLERPLVAELRTKHA
jgi:hypothetical protein